jgi:Phage integrase, N-terminal SAM-like domain
LRVQQVLSPDGGPESWTVVDERFAVVEPIDVFLAHLTAIERSPGTVRAYAFDLRDYFEFMDAHVIDWRTVCLEHLGRFVGWLRLPPTMRTASVTSLSTIEARRLELAHQRIRDLTEENKQLRTRLALVHGQRRVEQITSVRTLSTRQTP